jgi:ketosteroid isomerase-like protein
MTAGHQRSLAAIAAALICSSCVETPPPSPHGEPAPKPLSTAEPPPQPAPQPLQTPKKAAPLIVQSTPKVTSQTAEPVKPKTPDQTHPARDHSADLQTVLAADRAFANSVERKTAADAFHEHLTPDAVLMMPGELPVRGSDAIKVDLTVNPPGALLWHAKGAQVAEAGDLGYTWGTYEARPENIENSRFLSRFGKYVIIWERQKDQSWKACLFSASMSPAATEHR